MIPWTSCNCCLSRGGWMRGVIGIRGRAFRRSEPLAPLLESRRCAAQAGPNRRVVAEIDRRGVLVSGEPRLRGDLILLEKRLEALLVSGSVQHEPAGRRIRLTVAEDCVKSPRHLV